MTVSAENVKVVYDGDDTTTEWPYTFDIDDTSDIKLYLRDADDVVTEITANYSIDESAEIVTYPTVASGLDPVATGEELTIIRETPYEQDTTPGASYSASTLENALDKLELQIQQLAERVDRSIKYPVYSEGESEDPDDYIGDIEDLISEMNDLLNNPVFLAGITIGSDGPWTITESGNNLQFKRNGVLIHEIEG
jgi:hypothetical protein